MKTIQPATTHRLTSPKIPKTKESIMFLIVKTKDTDNSYKEKKRDILHTCQTMTDVMAHLTSIAKKNKNNIPADIEVEQWTNDGRMLITTYCPTKNETKPNSLTYSYTVTAKEGIDNE